MKKTLFLIAAATFMLVSMTGCKSKNNQAYGSEYVKIYIDNTEDCAKAGEQLSVFFDANEADILKSAESLVKSGKSPDEAFGMIFDIPDDKAEIIGSISEKCITDKTFLAGASRMEALSTKIENMGSSGDVKSTGSSDPACEGAIFHNECVLKGGEIVFGSYTQSEDDNKENTKSPLKWTVLNVDKYTRTILLLTVNVIDRKPYNTEKTAITWEECSLRKWLNDDFLKAAFDQNEQEEIMITHLNNPDVGMAKGGNVTDDKVFLLSKEELDNEDPKTMYFAPGKDSRKANRTWYANKNSQDPSMSWWLRTPSDWPHNKKESIVSDKTYIVDKTGVVQGMSGVNDPFVGVRPAISVRY